eukprot:6137183-Alexandrium_andersonii.AAC.1
MSSTAARAHFCRSMVNMMQSASGWAGGGLHHSASIDAHVPWTLRTSCSEAKRFKGTAHAGSVSLEGK